MFEVFCAGFVGFVLFLTHRVWIYRAAIIQCQADITLILNELTKPNPKQSIFCNLCNTKLTPDEYAHHFCERLTVRAKALNEAKAQHHAYDVR